ncbi:uncharacterized protein [Diabrotica undecimpunctata]|uniref:uncharacterized protein n=1 Tax=Diabrotica undecimpunctata TaxID=50387 RepID=UPI003B63F7B5
MVTVGFEHVYYIIYVVLIVPSILSFTEIGRDYHISTGTKIIIISAQYGPTILPHWCKVNPNIKYTGDKTCAFTEVHEALPFNEWVRQIKFESNSNITYLNWHSYNKNYFLRINLEDSTCNVWTIEENQIEGISVNRCLEQLNQNMDGSSYVQENEAKKLGRRYKKTIIASAVTNISSAPSTNNDTSTGAKSFHITTASLDSGKFDLHALLILLSVSVILMVLSFFIGLVYIIWRKCRSVQYRQTLHHDYSYMYGNPNLTYNNSLRSDGYLLPKTVEPPIYEEVIYAPPHTQPNYNSTTGDQSPRPPLAFP